MRKRRRKSVGEVERRSPRSGRSTSRTSNRNGSLVKCESVRHGTVVNTVLTDVCDKDKYVDLNGVARQDGGTDEDDVRHIDLLLSEGLETSAGNPCVDVSQPNLDTLDPNIDQQLVERLEADYWKKKKKKEERKRLPGLIPLFLLDEPTLDKKPLYSDTAWFDSIPALSSSSSKLSLSSAPYRIKLKCFLHWPTSIKLDMWDNILKFQRLVELRIDKKRNKLLTRYSKKLLSHNKKFVCFGCSFRCDRLSEQRSHISYQRNVNSLVYECKTCGFSDSAKCVINNHIRSHSLDPYYKQAMAAGMYCWRCHFHIRCKSYPAHKEILHTNMLVNSYSYEHLSHWREWFHGR